MAIPAYMLIDGVKGGVQVQTRENHIEILEFRHEVRIPVDMDTGSLTATRKHESLVFVKEFDISSPTLYQAVCNGTTFKTATIKWFKINEKGEENEYFEHVLQNVRCCSVKPIMMNVKNRDFERYVHMEEVSLRYEKITWKAIDGNYEFSDSWYEKR